MTEQDHVLILIFTLCDFDSYLGWQYFFCAYIVFNPYFHNVFTYLIFDYCLTVHCYFCSSLYSITANLSQCEHTLAAATLINDQNNPKQQTELYVSVPRKNYYLK